MNTHAAIDLEAMSDHDHLASLRMTHSEIDCALLVDLRAETVLCVSSHIDQPQEKLDALCSAASRFLGGQFGERSEFFLQTPLRTIIAHRVAGTEETALVVVFAPDTELGYARNITSQACACLRG